MSLASYFNFTKSSGTSDLPEIFKFPLVQGNFVSMDVENFFSRIMIDVLERTDGLKDEHKKIMWDNCVAGESPDGLVTLLSKAMTNKNDLFLVYKPAVGIVRKATPEEEAKIKEGYAANNKSPVGVFISFKNFNRSDMLKIYSALEYCTVSALWKTLNLSKAVQLKFTDMRASVGARDKDEIVAQAIKIATALEEGRDVYMDAKDLLEMLKPDLTSTNSAMDFIVQKKSFYSGMPVSYIGSPETKGLGDSGVGDAKAVERGLRNYYFPIIKPVVETLFGIKTTFKSDDFQNLSVALDALKTFEVTSDELMSQDNKLLVTNKLFGFPPETKGDKPKPEELPEVTPPKNGVPTAVK